MHSKAGAGERISKPWCSRFQIDTPPSTLISMACRFSFKLKRAVRQAGTPQGAFRFGSMQHRSQLSGPENMHQSPAVLCTGMIPARQVQPEARTATTASVYEALFGCPPQFASIADVIPESQGASGSIVKTPNDVQNMQATPSSLFAFSALTGRSDMPVYEVSAHKGQVRAHTLMPVIVLRTYCC
jgi:hypothetical protein